MTLRDEALEMHRRNQGKLEVAPKVKVTNKDEFRRYFSTALL